MFDWDLTEALTFLASALDLWIFGFFLNSSDSHAPSLSHSPSSSALQSPSLHQGIAAESILMEDNPFAPVDNHPFINVEPSSEASSSGDLSSAKSPYVSQTLHHLGK
ncbi:hypothetical protein Tco_0234929 [Tanacetum coccineum]